MQNNITKRLKGRVKQEFQGGDASTVNTILKVQLANKEEYIRNQDVVINLLTYLLLRYEMCVGDRDHKITCLKHTQAQALLTAPDSKDSESPHFAYRPKAVSIQAKATSSPVNAQNNGGGPTHSPVTMQDPASDKPDSDMDIDPSDEEEEMEVDSSASHVRERKRPHSSSSNSQPSNAVAAKACPSDNTAIMVSVSSRPSNRVRVHELEEEMCLSRVNFERLTVSAISSFPNVITPPPRQFAAVVRLDEETSMLYGGLVISDGLVFSNMDDVWRFDLNTVLWEVRTPAGLKGGQSGHSMCVLGNAFEKVIWSFGGSCDRCPGRLAVSRTLQIYLVDDDRWIDATGDPDFQDIQAEIEHQLTGTISSELAEVSPKQKLQERNQKNVLHVAFFDGYYSYVKCTYYLIVCSLFQLIR
eukprot:51926_1